MWATGRESFGDYNAAAAAGAAAAGGGGFMSNAQEQPGTSGGGGKFRGKNVGPVAIRQLIESKDDTLKIEDMEINTVVIVGLIRQVDVTTTRISYIIDDQTAVIEAVQHLGADDGVVDIGTILTEGTYARVVGMLRTPAKSAPGKKYVVMTKIMPVIDLNEITMHLLEVLQVPVKLKQLKAAQDTKIQGGGGMNNTIPSAVLGTSFGGGGNMGTTSGGGQMNEVGPSNGFTAHQNLILNIVKSCRTETGLHKNVIMQNIKNKMTIKELDAALEYLGAEGHIFSTVDDDHFKVTDW